VVPSSPLRPKAASALEQGKYILSSDPVDAACGFGPQPADIERTPVPPPNATPGIPAFVHDILDDNPTGYLGTIRPDGELSITPLALMFDGETIRLSTTMDRKKYRNLLADSRVALCVPHRKNPNRYVEVRGTARLVPDPERVFINSVARKYMDADVYPFDPPGTERVTIEIVPHQVSAPKIPLEAENPNGPDARRPGRTANLE
jgi:PPOX class probable F420-dependent enzyme